MKRVLCPSNCRPRAVVLMLSAAMLLSGCSKGGPSGKISSSAYDSAPPEVRQLWRDGLGAWKGHRYQEAATDFMTLQGKAASLSTQQVDALNQAMDEFGQAAFAVAEKGDAGAVQAVLTLRGGSGRESRKAR